MADYFFSLQMNIYRHFRQNKHRHESAYWLTRWYTEATLEDEENQ